MLVTDLVGSTALNEKIGDAAYLDRLREHDRIIRARLGEFDGVEFKHTGDGIGAWFYSSNAALDCASAVNLDFVGHAQLDLAPKMLVRIALSAGEPELIGTDLFGLAVTVAFRLLSVAQPGEVLLTADVAGLVRGSDHSLAHRGHHRLKGLALPVECFAIAARPLAGSDPRLA